MGEKTEKKDLQHDIRDKVIALLCNEKVEEFSIKYFDVEEASGDPYILKFAMTKEFI